MIRMVIMALAFVPLAAGPATAEGLDIKPLSMSDGDFGRPHDVAINANGTYLYVADLDNNAIKILDPGTLRTLGQFGAGDLAAPHDVSFDARGRVLVADTGNDRIAVYEVRVYKHETVANLVDSWTADGAIVTPEGVAPGPGGTVYVTNAAAGTVLRLKDGAETARAGDSGPEDGRLSRPHDVQVGPDGRVYVVDSGNHRIMVYDAALTLVGRLTQADYGFDEPKYLAFAEDGRLLIADEYNNRIVILDADHRVIGQIGTGDKGDGDDQLNWPEGVDIAGRYVWVADSHNHRIRLYRIGTLN